MAASGSESGIYLGSLDGKGDGKEPLRRLLGDLSSAKYFNGHLLFVRDQTLMAQPVDPKTMESKGDLFPVAEHISPGSNPTDELYSISENGILVFQTGGAPRGRQHIWKDRTGKEVGPAGGRYDHRGQFRAVARWQTLGYAARGPPRRPAHRPVDHGP